MTGGSGGAGGNGSDDSSDSGGNGAGNGSSGNNEDSSNSQGGSSSEGNGGDSSGGGGGGGGGSTGGSSKGASGSFADKGLQAHNMFRKIHGSPPMKLDSQMSKDAEEYAKKLASMGTLQHSGREARKGAGENLAMKCSSRKEDVMTAEEATKNWLVFFLIQDWVVVASHIVFVCVIYLFLAITELVQSTSR